MSITDLTETRGFLEEYFDEFAAYLSKGPNAPPPREAHHRAGEIIENIGDAISFGYALYEMEDYVE